MDAAVLWILLVMVGAPDHGGAAKPIASFVQQEDCENFIAAFHKAREKPPEMRCVSVPQDKVVSPNAEEEKPE